MEKFSKIAIIALIFLLAGAVYIIFAKPFSPEVPPGEAPAEPPPPAETTLTAPPSSENVSPPEPPPPGFEEKVTTFWQAMAEVSTTGESQEVTLVFTEAEVNEQAAKLLTQVEIPEDIPMEVKSIHIDLKPDNNLLTEAETAILGFGVTLKASSQVGISEGKPDVTITDVSFGAIPIPGTVKEKIVAFITHKIDEVLVQLTESAADGGIDAEFKDINVAEEKVTITVLIEKVAE